jgi:hypothetical protein
LWVIFARILNQPPALRILHKAEDPAATLQQLLAEVGVYPRAHP